VTEFLDDLRRDAPELRLLKGALDPLGILNPGKVV
jgi:FAD/FMN-containing dehydrogenase